MVGELILTFFMFRHLRRSLNEALRPEWDSILKGGMVASISLLVGGFIFDIIDQLNHWLAFALILYITFLIYTKKEFHGTKSHVTAYAPFAIASFLRALTEKFATSFFDEWGNYFEAGVAFSLIWMIVMLIITNRQQKALAEERQKTQEEEKQNKIMAEMKAQLEIQVKERTAELTRQKEELEQTVSELKTTQDQLIQSEKMASLGELIAGIAHEIQNPLNFVNNFSEVNKELADELLEEIEKGEIEEVKVLAKDILDNQEKVAFHGKRAEEIVRSMLQHSRNNSGEKELTDINQLADEYLRLAFHGLRAKDKSFNAEFETDFDESLPALQVVPQDIGRVLLNLINNAFQAVKEVDKPKVEVKTTDKKKDVEVVISDNGPGIPDEIKDKILQPFFTTKPTGKGTGLGLSMSYDIITKGHKGQLDFKSKMGEGTQFTISIPKQQNS